MHNSYRIRLQWNLKTSGGIVVIVERISHTQKLALYYPLVMREGIKHLLARAKGISDTFGAG